MYLDELIGQTTLAAGRFFVTYSFLPTVSLIEAMLSAEVLAALIVTVMQWAPIRQAPRMVSRVYAMVQRVRGAKCAQRGRLEAMGQGGRAHDDITRKAVNM
jgi:hypothetical protein